MYIKHNLFSQPEPNTKIWRYVDLVVLLDLIDSKKLFFARADKFNDILEGSVPLANVEKRKKYGENIKDEGARRVFQDAMKQPMSNWIKERLKHTAISCWHMNENESALMWSSYSGDGVAIQSTYERLKQSFQTEIDIYMGIVKYIDYRKNIIPDGDVRLFQYIYKSINYLDEKEVRALIITTDKEKIAGSGLKINIDLSCLIENIFISPRMPIWKANLLKNILVRYGFNLNVVHTGMNMHPHY